MSEREFTQPLTVEEQVARILKNEKIDVPSEKQLIAVHEMAERLVKIANLPDKPIPPSTFNYNRPLDLKFSGVFLRSRQRIEKCDSGSYKKIELPSDLKIDDSIQFSFGVGSAAD